MAKVAGRSRDDGAPPRAAGRSRGWWARLTAGVTLLAAVAGIVAVLRPTPLFPDRAEADLEVAAFDVGVVARPSEVTFGTGADSVTQTDENDVARVQIGLRNRGDAPAFLTRAVFTVAAHETLDTCVPIGDAVYVTESVDVQVPYELDRVPWVHEQGLSFRVAPNEVDRLEFTFSVPDMPPFVQPVVLSVDIAVQEDDADEPLAVGTARLVLPASNVAALVGLTEEPPAPAEPGCNAANLDRVHSVLAAPALDPAASSEQLTELLAALESYQDGVFYTFPDP